MDEIKEQVQEQINELKRLTQTSKNIDLAKSLGVARNTIQNWKVRGKVPDSVLLKAQQIAEHIAKNGASPINNFVSLDFYDIEVSAGHGTLVMQEDQNDYITFSRKFIDEVIGVNAKDVFMMPVKGDSMAPTLKNQALIMVSRIKEFSGDGIYVFRFDNRLMVKRLQFSKAGLTVVSDNTTYKEWELSRDELATEDFEIIGEVVWSGQRM
ncbi:LexA family transcriptional regulator [Psychromonas ossibalaenae]|uniref:LexA family transcriptional regulator n=1 Tax=Psychromonas ossibalaenae TaxID=444922 RepID=UPI0003619DDD|nr:S24 family peptidase [Psychromonas ossibalaenae]